MTAPQVTVTQIKGAPCVDPSIGPGNLMQFEEAFKAAFGTSERVAHFMLELLTRFQLIGRADECSFPMPPTQELLGDALSLSLPYVNRTLRQLREDGLVSIEAH